MRKMVLFMLCIMGAGLFGQGIPYGQVFRVNTYTENNQWYPKIAALEKGGFAVCWWSGGQDGSSSGVYGQVFSSDGAKISQEFRVNTYTADDQWFSEITSLSNGGFVVCWSRDFSALYGQIFSSDGSKIGQEFSINTHTVGSMNQRITSLSDGGFAVCWEGSGPDWFSEGLYVQVFSSAGVKIGQEFYLFEPHNTYLNEWKFIIASLSNHGFMVCWDNRNFLEYGCDVSGQVFSSVGTKIGQEFRVNTYTESDQTNPQIAPLPNGDFVVCWNSMNQDGSGWGVYGQVFSSDGVKIGQEFRINTYTVDYQMAPAIKSLSNSRFLVCWMSLGQDGDREGIYGQLFSSDGSRIGQEFPVNTSTDGGQMDPQISTLPNGGFVVCWWSGDYGVYGQLFSSEGEKIGHEFRVNADYLVFQGAWKWQIMSLSGGDFIVCWETSSPYSWDFEVYAKRYPGSPLKHELKPFSLLMPSNDKSVMTVNPSLTWRQSTNELICYFWELHYKIYIDDDPDFSSPQIIEKDQDTTVTVRDLKKGTTYFWKVLAKNIAGDSLWSSSTNAFFVSRDASGVEEEKSKLPGQSILHPNYPNPFNPETTIRFDLPESGFVIISVYDINGRLIRVLLNESRTAGSYSVKWDGKDQMGNAVPSGIYVCRMEVRSADGHKFTQSMKMGLVR